ncbi:hypothetical protein AKJ53_00995 [candidate division MSBL1 archaeon SCGC-AAA382F02]|uniref:Cyclophilin TM1367-like domain-containing protein n=1 Tax=candidate division MSBL1 archaeon SCGC-AAA382F02 TaxID=1698282 RepID=A0A133VIF1_9EURY|nr:hypothetical protein AKJ53_00995 [candidate division MSBL1 archaeon SCGC-AAA382F02]
MTKKISILVNDFEIEATLLEDKCPQTCAKIWESLPLKGKAKIYKEEIYFDIPIEIEPENAIPNTEQGDISYWPEGPAFCIFFGDSQPVSPVNTFGKIEEGIEKLQQVEQGDKVTVRKSPSGQEL